MTQRIGCEYGEWMGCAHAVYLTVGVNEDITHRVDTLIVAMGKVVVEQETVTQVSCNVTGIGYKHAMIIGDRGVARSIGGYFPGFIMSRAIVGAESQSNLGVPVIRESISILVVVTGPACILIDTNRANLIIFGLGLGHVVSIHGTVHVKAVSMISSDQDQRIIQFVMFLCNTDLNQYL